MDEPLARNNNGLTLSIPLHVSVSIFGDSKQMRFQISAPSSTIGLDNLGTVESDALKRIDGN